MSTTPLHADLSPGRFLLVEASAGTGKTWLTEALVLRLVAEEDLPIGRLLLITFTNAATAELRARVRGRLADARALLSSAHAEPPRDPALRRLWDEVACTRADALERVTRALADFDLAPISTIHGFCQRMLTQHAHLLDLDPGLSVATGADDIVEEIVADAMATVWAACSADEARALQQNGWTRDRLAQLAAEMVGGWAPLVVPPLAPADAERTLGELLARWQEVAADLRAWTGTAEGRGALAACDALAGARGTNNKALYPRCPPRLGGAFQDWAARGAPLRESGASPLHWLSDETRSTRWNGDDAHAAWPAFRKFEETVAGLEDGITTLLSAFAARVRPRVEATLRRRGLLTYDAILSHLAQRLAAEADPEGPVARAVRSLYDAAIVDEFQDTDLAQWTTLRAVFRHADCRLVAVGDPKQSIYAFRGADIDVYLAARDHAACATLDANQRSDEAVIAAMNELWAGQTASMGQGIPYVAVKATKEDRLVRVGGGAIRRPVELRTFDDTLGGGDGSGWPSKGVAQVRLAGACAREIDAVLGDDTLRVLTDAGARPLTPRDVAVIVRSHRQAELVRDALGQLGWPAVASGGRSRVEDGAATEWVLTWLEAVGDVERDGGARRWALTPLVGWSPLRLGRAVAVLDAPESGGAPGGALPGAEEARAFDALRTELRATAEAWADTGFWVAFERSLRHHDALARVLATGGERDATDLRQLMALLHTEERARRLSPRALAEWLRGRRSGARASEEAESDLELETDRSAVRIVTMHASKGLQFPIVFLPFAWEEPEWKDGKKPVVVSGPDPAGRGGLPRRTLYLAASGDPARDAAAATQQQRAAEERMRLLYVAMTRAEHHLVAWVGRSSSKDKAEPAALRLLGLAGAAPADVRARIDELHAGWGPLRTVAAETIASPPPPVGATLGVFLDRTWPDAFGLGFQRTSYTALAAGKSHSAEVLPDGADPAALVADPTLSAPAPGHPIFAGGTGLGTLVHAVFEHVDFRCGAPRADRADGAAAGTLAALVARLGQRYGHVDGDAHADLVTLLPGWLGTPLHLDADHPSHPWSPPRGFRLADLALADRRDELVFDLALGGPGAGDRVDPARVNRVVDDLLAADAPAGTSGAALDWLRAVREEQRRRDLDAGAHAAPAHPRSLVGRLRGLLNGSIDLLLRAPSDGGGHRYWVCDYKTNAVRGPRALQDLVADLAKRAPPARGDATQRNLHFSRPLLGWEMAHAAYHLQALVYTVALHRMLGQRLPGYREGGQATYDRHVGGHLYLFVRGMAGASTPRHGGAALGVWADRWPFPLVDGLDRALRGAEVRA